MTSPHRTRSQSNVLKQLLDIPKTPLLENIAYGTCVEVLRYKRSPLMNTVRSPWAIKRINNSISSRYDPDENTIKKRLFEEASILRSLNHPNIVGFRGRTNVNGILTLVMEDCHDSLGGILEDRSDETDLGPLEVQYIKKMCADTIEGLHYLHTKAHYLHGDIKSCNILVKGNFDICKICDFGASLPLNKDGFIDTIKNPMAKYIGTENWYPPEALINNNEKNISYKADIFCFGLIIYECIALIEPHLLKCHLESAEDWLEILEDEKNFLSGMVTAPNDDEDKFKEYDTMYGTRPVFHKSLILDNEYNSIVDLFNNCTNANPEDRPSASSLRSLFSN